MPDSDMRSNLVYSKLNYTVCIPTCWMRSWPTLSMYNHNVCTACIYHYSGVILGASTVQWGPLSLREISATVTPKCEGGKTWLCLTVGTCLLSNQDKLWGDLAWTLYRNFFLLSGRRRRGGGGYDSERTFLQDEQKSSHLCDVSGRSGG